MQKIVPIGKRMGYLDAFNAVRDKGGLPSNVLHDDTLLNSSVWEKIKQEFSTYYWAWAREIIAYPDKYGVFGKGDIKDHDYDWILQAKYVPKAAIGKKGIALVIDPKDLQVVEGQVRVIPKTVTILKGFPQANGWYDYDKATRIPIDAKPKSDTYGAKRYLWRCDEQSVRPLSRDDDYYFGVNRRFVYAVGRPDDRLGVGFVQDARAEPGRPLTDKEAREKLAGFEQRIADLEKTASENADKLDKIKAILA